MSFCTILFYFPLTFFSPFASFSICFTLSPYMGLPPLFGRACFSSSYLDTSFQLLHSPSSPRTSHKNESSSLFPLVSPSLPFTTDVESPPSRLSASIHALFWSALRLGGGEGGLLTLWAVNEDDLALFTRSEYISPSFFSVIVRRKRRHGVTTEGKQEKNVSINFECGGAARRAGFGGYCSCVSCGSLCNRIW